MNKKLQVFVSSTYTDLIEERQAAVEAILDAGHIPAGMELFKAGNESQLQTIYKWIDESDVYMLILGGRYGSIEKKSGKSYTQLEYEYASSKDIPIFTVVLSDLFLTDKINSLGLKDTTEQIAPDKYQTFKSLVMSKNIRTVDDCKDIKINVLSSLNIFKEDPSLRGWIRTPLKNDIAKFEQKNLSLKNDIAKFKQENLSLKNDIAKFKQENLSLKNNIAKFEQENLSLKNKVIQLDERNNFPKESCKTQNHITQLNTRNITHLDQNTFNRIKDTLQSKSFLITLNPDENFQKTGIQDCFTIFLNNYSILENGVLNSKYKWQTGLLYTHVCPFLYKFSLVDITTHQEYGIVYRISDTGTTFYKMAMGLTPNT